MEIHSISSVVQSSSCFTRVRWPRIGSNGSSLPPWCPNKCPTPACFPFASAFALNSCGLSWKRVMSRRTCCKQVHTKTHLCTQDDLNLRTSAGQKSKNNRSTKQRCNTISIWIMLMGHSSERMHARIIRDGWASWCWCSKCAQFLACYIGTSAQHDSSVEPEFKHKIKVRERATNNNVTWNDESDTII